MTFGATILIGVHALIAWILIETFVNLAHGLSRRSYVFWHYIVVIMAFAGLFRFYTRFFDSGVSPFTVTVVAMGFVFGFEFVVFRFLYSGERWFLNWVDWIFPVFLASSTIYAVVFFW
ncbi:hypothetical protein HY626_03730 [Candidatus Uhrbacteria bacterium]|nr:hypothetical protein [Candidatus Uhrbacteria bacterium]